MQKYLKQLSEKLFLNLNASEQLGLSLHSENSTFIRFNNSKVRQNTTVNQHELTLIYQTEKKSIKQRYNLTLELATDVEMGLEILNVSKQQLRLIDTFPQYVPLENHGQSEVIRKIPHLPVEEVPQFIHSVFSDSDLTGLWCSGPLIEASINSLGQFHYYENDFFFFDYSLYNGPKAAKGFYAAETWDADHFKTSAQSTKNKLNLLSKPVVKIKPGQYRTYLEPLAVAEILYMFNWGAMSQGAYKQGRSALKKLVEKEKHFSQKFSLTENFDSGYAPLFNQLGELSKPQISLIEKGELVSFLTSTATANEYNLVSNSANQREAPRSPEIRAGTLDSKEALAQLGTGLYLSNLHYLNWSDLQTARITGMTRFACFWVENGEIVGPIQDLRFDETLYNLFGANLVDFTTQQEILVSSETYLQRTTGAMKVPGALIEKFNFTL